MAKISVIIPIYNTEQYLCRCLDSVLAQSFEEFELLLVDDGSTDNCRFICDEYARNDNRIKIFHQENKGQAAARNLALDWVFSNSDSEYISFVDSDDWVHPKYLELLHFAMLEFDAKISQCRHIETEKWIESKIEIEPKVLYVSPEEQYSNWYSAFFWGKLFHKSSFCSVRFPEGKIFEDVLIWYKMLFEYDGIAIVDEVLYFYFQRSDNTTNISWTPAKLAQIEAWEDQFAFTLKRGNKPALHTALKRFCWVYKHQCEEIVVSNLISKKERKKYYSKLINRLRFVIFKYKNTLKEAGIFSYYFEWAFPRINWIYWTFKGIRGKIRRGMRE